ncbi:MAG: chemotaxis protein CheW [Anaeromyxobacter sp.]
MGVASSRFAVFGVGSHLVGIPADRVKEMFVLPEIRVPPGIPAHQRGVARLRGSVLPAIDLRVCLGLTSSGVEVDAFVQLLVDREQDHRSWLGELEACVREGRKFTLATDPRQCRFGKWYYGFKTDDPVLRMALDAFEQPHADIHGLAQQAEALLAEGHAAQAQQLVERARTGVLAELIGIFARTRTLVREQRKEVGVTVQLGGRDAALIVDRAEAVTEVEPLPEKDDPLRGGALESHLVERMGRWKGSNAPVLLLSLEKVAALR